MSRRLVLALVAALLPAAPALALPPLGEQEAIVEGLFQIALAYEIDRVCDELDGRRLQGFQQLLGLHAQARGLGYSMAEIDAWVDDDAEKDRLEALARRRLRDMGAVPGEPATYCALGRRLMAEDTPAGRLLSD